MSVEQRPNFERLGQYDRPHSLVMALAVGLPLYWGLIWTLGVALTPIFLAASVGMATALAGFLYVLMLFSAYAS